MEKVAGIFGASVAAVVTVFSFIIGAVVLVVLWRSGALPILGEALLIIVRGLFVTLPVEAFSFLRDLISFAAAGT